MQQDSILRQVIAFACVTALSIALCTIFARAEDTAPAGKTTGSPAASQAGNIPIIELPQDIAREKPGKRPRRVGGSSQNCPDRRWSRLPILDLQRDRPRPNDPSAPGG